MIIRFRSFRWIIGSILSICVFAVSVDPYALLFLLSFSTISTVVFPVYSITNLT